MINYLVKVVPGTVSYTILDSTRWLKNEVLLIEQVNRTDLSVISVNWLASVIVR